MILKKKKILRGIGICFEFNIRVDSEICFGDLVSFAGRIRGLCECVNFIVLEQKRYPLSFCLHNEDDIVRRVTHIEPSCYQFQL